jgi:hypothetical protein
MNLGGLEALAQEIAGQAILDHAKETESRLVGVHGQLIPSLCCMLPVGALNDHWRRQYRFNFRAIWLNCSPCITGCEAREAGKARRRRLREAARAAAIDADEAARTRARVAV